VTKTDLRDRRRLNERGAVLATVAIWTPVLILFVIFVVDMGNWFVHKRHLQLQADAAALAAGGSFTIPCADAPVEQNARTYGGDPSAIDPYNLQYAPTAPENIHLLVNSTEFWNHGGTDFSDGGPPCTAKFVDVKITEADLPWFFGVDVVPAINARARVSIQALTHLNGALPVGVPDVNPKSGRVSFINEATGTEIASAPLLKTGRSGGLAIWDNSASPVSVPINSASIGVRVVLAGGVSTACGEFLVECYDAESANGMLHIRGWSSGGSGAQPNPPIVRDVHLTAAGCSDPYFFVGSSSCTVNVRASVDFGGDPTAVGAGVTAVADGREASLGYNAGTAYWEGTVSVPANAGPVPVELRWSETQGTQGGNTCSTGGGNRCKGSFGTVQRTFSGLPDRSGPIEVAQVWNYDDPSNPTFWANSFETGTSHSLVVKIGLAGSLENATSVDSPLVLLRVTGSRNQSVDCDRNLPNLRDEIAQGCAPEYAINDGTVICPSTATSLWSSPQPYRCVPIQTGGAVGQVEKGMEDRILGGASTCTSPSNWADFPNIPGTDPRVVPVFLTPFGSFSGSGNGVVPVINFGAFYVTGWFGDPCVGDDPVPRRGYIVGRFIKHVFVLNDGSGSDELCNFDSFGSCIAVLTD
jgi:hypothetical protein